MELGQHAELLGIMDSVEMLSRFFINDTSTASQQWRIKRHLCPLQLDVIERALVMWSNPGGRRFIGVELKESYFRQAARNLQSQEDGAATLFDAVAA